MVLRWLMRGLFVAFATGFAIQLYDVVYGEAAWEEESIPVIYAAIAAVVAGGIVFFEARFQRNLAREIVAVAFGMATGIVISFFIVALMVAFILPREGNLGGAFAAIQIWIPMIMTAVCYVSVTIVLQTKGDFRFLIPYIDFSHRGVEDGGYVLDSSAIIDGRINDIADTNIIARPIIIPDFVIHELQTVADSADKLKRKRGRRGLDIVGKLQKNESLRLKLFDSDVPEKCDVDHELVMLAKRLNSRVVTTDFNLNKVAQIEGVQVMNINDLANALKAVVLPGEDMRVRIIRPGEESGQGVGYLEDGTMVVVERGREFVDKDVDIIVTGSIQTSAGRMVFGKVKSEESERLSKEDLSVAQEKMKRQQQRDMS